MGNIGPQYMNNKEVYDYYKSVSYERGVLAVGKRTKSKLEKTARHFRLSEREVRRIVRKYQDGR